MTTLFVCTIGGHLTALHELGPRFRGIDVEGGVWVTHDCPQSRSLLSEHDVQFVPYIEERDVRGVLKAIPHAWRLVRARGIDAVVSTGSAIAVPYMAVARLHRARCYFIESTAFVTGHSRTARILRWVPGVRLFCQSRQLANRTFTYAGSTLDGFVAAEPSEGRHPRRIVVTVGTSTEFGYRRLIERLAAVIPPEVDVLWQTGVTDVTELDISATPWLSQAELFRAMESADLVIAHAGGGTTIDCLTAGQRPLLVPRRAAAGDFRDDHQLQIAERLRLADLAEVASVEELDWPLLCRSAGRRVDRQSPVPPIVLEPRAA